MDRMVLINVPIVSAHSMCFEHMCECLGRARPTLILGLVDVMLCCCLGFGTLNIIVCTHWSSGSLGCGPSPSFDNQGG